MSEPYWVPLGAAPAPGAMQLIADVTLGAAAPEILFSGIPQTFSHLKLVGLLRGDAAASFAGLRFQFNGDTAANYDSQTSVIQSSVVTGSEALGQAFILGADCLVGASAAAGRFSPVDLTAPDYRSVAASKILLGKLGLPYGVGTQQTSLRDLLGVWRTLAAITSIRVTPASGNFIAGSRLTLYGLT